MRFLSSKLPFCWNITFMSSRCYLCAESSCNAIPLHTQGDSLAAYPNIASTFLVLCTLIHIFWTRPELDVTFFIFLFFVHRMAFLLLALLVKCLLPITPPQLSSFINNSAGAQVKVMTAKLCVISSSHKIKAALL